MAKIYPISTHKPQEATARVWATMLSVPWPVP